MIRSIEIAGRYQPAAVCDGCGAVAAPPDYQSPWRIRVAINRLGWNTRFEKGGAVSCWCPKCVKEDKHRG